MELCVHVKCSTKEQHKKLVNLCSEPGLHIDLEQSWSSWLAETRAQEPANQADREGGAAGESWGESMATWLQSKLHT